MISERTLRRWRREALVLAQQKHTPPIKEHPEAHNGNSLIIDELTQRVLRLTQELLDHYMVRKA